MSAIDPELSDKIFSAIQTIREYLPEAEALSALIPGYGFEVVAAERFLGKLFELIVALRSSENRVDAAATLQKQTEADWAAALRRE